MSSCHIPSWLKENEQFFQPPVCNKMLYGEGQMKAFFVGGPNQRKDFHIEEGEELFYQRKGDMVLKIVERGVHKDVVIKEGELFLLPARIPHSPQRYENTVGLVFERERTESELDGLRYYVDGTTSSLYEKWFHCDDLGKDLPPVIKEYFASEQHRTQKPIPGTIPDPSPVTLDSETVVDAPFPLLKWLDDNDAELTKNGFLAMFDRQKWQFSVTVVKGKRAISFGSNDGTKHAETVIWQLKGVLDVTGGVDPVNEGQGLRKGIHFDFSLQPDSTRLLPKGAEFEIQNLEHEGTTLVILQDPTKKQK